MRALVTRVQGGVGSREDWSNLAALTLIWQGDPAITAIVAEGFDAFVQTCEAAYETHRFRPEDYRRMYARVCAAATRIDHDRVH